MHMHRRVRLVAVLLASTGTVGALLFAVAPASATSITVTVPLKNWAVWGSLTPKKLGEPVTLPKGSAFNGASELTEPGTTGKVKGSITVPPFKASLKLAGLLPTEVGLTFTEVGSTEGTIAPAAPTDCPKPTFKGVCVNVNATSKANIGITEVGLLGIETPQHCETSEPVPFALSATETIAEVLQVGSHFTGTVTIPSISCEGLTGVLVAPVLTAVMSGPENPFDLHLTPVEPGPPTFEKHPLFESYEATGVTQISAKLNASVDPNGEPLSECRFEYGTSSAYGTSVPCTLPPESGFAAHAQLTGLSESTTYHYRVVAANARGTGEGPDETFTTLGPAGAPEFGRCVALKKGNYVDGGCTKLGEKKGQPVEHAGSYEWEPGPAPSCVTQKKGEYTDPGCTTRSAKAHKGSYEKVGGPGYTATSGTVTLETAGLAQQVVCSASSATGEVTGAQGGLEHITLSGCEAGGKKCTSEGPNSTPSGTPGVIASNRLKTRLLGPVSGAAVWTEYVSSEHEPYLWEFGCEGRLYRTAGSVAGVQTGDIDQPSSTSTTTFTLEGGEQALYSALSEDGGKSWIGPEPSSLVMTDSNTSAAEVEIKG